MLLYNIIVHHGLSDKDINNVCNIAYLAGKDCVGCSFHNKGVGKFTVAGKFSDVVRVYSALKNNGYKPTMARDKYE